jgi:hypothetical protein
MADTVSWSKSNQTIRKAISFGFAKKSSTWRVALAYGLEHAL